MFHFLKSVADYEPEGVTFPVKVPQENAVVAKRSSLLLERKILPYFVLDIYITGSLEIYSVLFFSNFDAGIFLISILQKRTLRLQRDVLFIYNHRVHLGSMI